MFPTSLYRPPPAQPDAARRIDAWDAALVVAVAWTAHFALFRRFGLYEDDYWYVGRTLGWTADDARRWAETCVRALPMGRPIGFLIGTIVPFLCFQLGGLRALPFVYLCGSLVVSLNALLAYRLLRLPYGRSFALIGALAFTLHPADTTHTLLTHNLALQPALTFLLLALLAYVRGRRVVSYFLAAGALLTYESAVLPFFAAPLLLPDWDRRLLRKWARHVVLVAAIVLAVVLLRRWMGDARIVDLHRGITTVPWRIVRSVFIGPQVSLGAFLERSAYAIRWLGPNHLVRAALAALALFTMLFLRRFGAEKLDRSTLARAAVTGLVMLAAGYGFAFTADHFPPTERAGRLTSVHLGATLGASMVFAALACAGWTIARSRRARITAAVLTAFVVSSLFGFRLLVQRGFVTSAEHQRAYWQTIVHLVPDLSEDTTVLLLGAEPAASNFILTSSWADTIVLPLLFRAPGGRSPQLVGGEERFRESFLSARDGELWWSPNAPDWLAIDRTVPLRRVVVLELTSSGWQRRVGSITFHGITIPLPPPPVGARIALKKGPLYPLLLGERS